ncbi:uncharacterized serine-rich protein C215.13-like [Cyclospora cayetanensis]|uniref:Uncharacterized serine-rich protein C215.13-like n=1 Tax=Cyclospora cayetanensis TaxID=88456 RepID=A0A6P6RVW9_9EIME|nr:uncharacterized serine-rich protein C215.13-like [Cyclospora cayetanensis]
MSPLVLRGLCALLAVTAIDGGFAASSSRPSQRVRSSSASDNTTAQGVRTGLRGSLEALRERSSNGNGNGSNDINGNARSGNGSASSLEEALSQPATIELAAVALSSINTFWLSLSPAARSELLKEMGSAAQENGDQLDAEDVADSASSSPASLSNGSVATLSSNQASRSINGNSRRSTVRSRQLSEDAALFRVLQRLDSSSRPPPGVSSTSTVRPLSSFSSTRAAISLSSSTSYSASAISLTTRPTAVGSLDDSDLEDNEDDEGIEDTDEIEFEEVEISPEDSEAQDSALDRLRERLRTLKLEQEDIILAFRGFVRRFHDYLDSYNERLFEYVNSEEFEAQIDRLREAVRQYDEEHPHEDHEEEEGEAPGGPLPPGRRTTTTTEAPGGSSTTLAAADGSSTTLAAADAALATEPNLGGRARPQGITVWSEPPVTHGIYGTGVVRC